MFPSPLSTPILLVCLSCTLSWTSLGPAAEYLGADVILEQAEVTPRKVATPEDKLRRRMAEYKPEGMSPEKAALEWLDLLDEQRAERKSNQQGETVDIREIFQLLPPPSTWEALKAAVKDRPPTQDDEFSYEVSLLITAEFLTDNRMGALEELRKFRNIDYRHRHGYSPLDSVEEYLVTSSGDPKLIIPYLEKQTSRKLGERRSLSIPNLVSIVGREEAAALLKRIFTETNLSVTVYSSGKETAALAREVALENIDALKQAPWHLAANIKGAALFEALEKKFPDSKNASERQRAEGYYLLSLVAQGKIDQAEKRIASLPNDDDYLLPYDGVRSLEQQGKSRDFFEFMNSALSKNPNLPFWNRYISLAIKVGQTDQALKRVNEARASSKLSEKTRREINGELPQILLALDQVEDGIAALQAAIKAPISENVENEGKAEHRKKKAFEARALAAERLTKLGLLLQRKPLVDEGLAALQATIDLANASDIDFHREGRNLPGLLFKAGRGDDAEKVLGDALKNKRNTQSTLADLAALYSLAGRDADVITLLQDAPGWESADLLQLVNQSTTNFSKDRSSLPLGYIAAKALAATGKPEAAEAILKQLIQEKPGYDPAYELLLTLKGPAAIGDLDRMITQDRFQERPLIWKAQLLFDAGKLDDAEKTVRQAIAIDPSDGEEGPDDRMRAYAVLAKIREARGDTKDAAFFNNVIKAIRLSEEADGYASAGLRTQAAAMYQKALTYFADAYCVQSRLAKNLWELGRYEEAEAHYRRAYELMPDSFGRVESHCFGCESAFAGEKQQSMAEKIFRKLVQETPTKPQVHYLLGYLVEEQGKEGEALVSYREAVKLDPDYLNAWKKIARLGGPMPIEEQEDAVLQMLRLDPLGRHGGRDSLRKVQNPKKLWTAVDLAIKAEEPAPQTLYPLKASRKTLERQKAGVMPRDSSYDRSTFSPGKSVYELLSPVVQNFRY